MVLNFFLLHTTQTFYTAVAYHEAIKDFDLLKIFLLNKKCTQSKIKCEGCNCFFFQPADQRGV